MRSYGEREKRDECNLMVLMLDQFHCRLAKVFSWTVLAQNKVLNVNHTARSDILVLSFWSYAECSVMFIIFISDMIGSPIRNVAETLWKFSVRHFPDSRYLLDLNSISINQKSSMCSSPVIKKIHSAKSLVLSAGSGRLNHVGLEYCCFSVFPCPSHCPAEEERIIGGSF